MKRYVIEFYDFGAWNIMNDSRNPYGWEHKSQAIERCEQLNRETDHMTREGAFCGHRYRVREREINV
jgi:hypothetical protein